MQKHAPLPTHSNRRVRAGFARQAVFDAFGHHGWALDHGNFVDRLPDQAPRRIDARPAREVA